jgi:hypothetical protein
MTVLMLNLAGTSFYSRPEVRGHLTALTARHVGSKSSYSEADFADNDNSIQTQCFRILQAAPHSARMAFSSRVGQKLLTGQRMTPR